MEKRNCFTKFQLHFALALSQANFFAFFTTGGVLTLFKENVYFIRIYKLIMHETFQLILHIEKST